MKRVRRIILIVVLVPILVVGGYILIRYISFVNSNDPNKTFLLPKLEQAVFDVQEMTAETTNVNARMLITNPLPFRVTADSVAYQIYIMDTLVVKSTYREQIYLRAGDSSWVNVPIALYNEKLEKIIDRMEGAGVDSVYYEVKASFYARKPLHRTFNVNVKKKLPLVYMPEVKVTHVGLDSIRLTHIYLLVHARVVNKNVFAINAKALTYRFAVAGNPWIEGSRPGLTDIPPKSVTDVAFPVEISLKEVGQTVFDLIKKGKNINYKFEMTLTAQSKERFLDNSRIVLKTKGIIDELVQMIIPEKKETRKEKKSHKRKRSGK